MTRVTVDAEALARLGQQLLIEETEAQRLDAEVDAAWKALPDDNGPPFRSSEATRAYNAMVDVENRRQAQYARLRTLKKDIVRAVRDMAKAAAAQPPTPLPERHYRHIKSGKVYQMIGAVKHKVLGERWADAVLYRSEAGELFSREVENFHQSFVPVVGDSPQPEQEVTP